ncbi:MAG: hypothetical protein BWY64_02785 [bacterium ADurb.Bin363]|nr:MAG: hypothetical protein BWY64_02785 [bacterium ADurb.Bin363]
MSDINHILSIQGQTAKIDKEKKDSLSVNGEDNLQNIQDKVEITNKKNDAKLLEDIRKFHNRTLHTKSVKTTELVKPELKPSVEELIEKIRKISETGSGELPLLDIVNLFPGLPPDIIDKLNERGPLKFKSTGPSAIGFENSGKKIDFKIMLEEKEYTVKIPSTIKGKTSVLPDGFKMDFDKKNTIQVGKLLFFINLEHLDANKDKVFVDFEGDMADIIIKFA